MLWLRAIIAFLTLPGVMAGLLPWLIVHADHGRAAPGFWWLGIVPLVIGAAILLWSVWDFFSRGQGTLAPWDPPRHLVIGGLYRYTRNPMYVGMTLLLAGLILMTGSKWLALYSIVLVIGFHLRILLYEEPILKKQFGSEFEAYCVRVPRWIFKATDR